VDCFLHISFALPGNSQNEAWLPATYIEDNDGKLPFWAHRLEPAWLYTCGVYIAMLLIPDLLGFSSHPDKVYGYIQCSVHSGKVAFSDLPSEIRLRIMQLAGLVQSPAIQRYDECCVKPCRCELAPRQASQLDVDGILDEADVVEWPKYTVALEDEGTNAEVP
jgi:hypothetical protein